MAGLKPYAVYPDLDHLRDELLQDNAHLLAPRGPLAGRPKRQ
jgi:hypothetical protein